MFKDRTDAGQRLAKALSKYKNQKDAIVIGLPRGGVTVAYEIARDLHLPLDIIAVAKLGAPHNPELAIGAIAADEVLLDQDMIDSLGVSEKYLQEEIAKKKKEVERRLLAFRGKKPDLSFTGKIVILVDDGMATGSTMEAAQHAISKKNPKKIIIAVPVAPPETLKKFSGKVDEIVCLLSPDDMMAVGQFYGSFEQVEDQEVIRLLKNQQ